MSIKVGDKVKYVGTSYSSVVGQTGVVEYIEEEFRRDTMAFIRVAFPPTKTQQESGLRSGPSLPCFERELELV